LEKIDPYLTSDGIPSKNFHDKPQFDSPLKYCHLIVFYLILSNSGSTEKGYLLTPDGVFLYKFVKVRRLKLTDADPLKKFHRKAKITLCLPGD
jgi:hypothetical protein